MTFVDYELCGLGTLDLRSLVNEKFFSFGNELCGL